MGRKKKQTKSGGEEGKAAQEEGKAGSAGDTQEPVP